MGNANAFESLAEEKRQMAAAERMVLEGCRKQRPEAFRCFVMEHQKAIFDLISRVVGRGPQVRDLAQETFLRTYRAFPNFDIDGPATVRTRVLTIAVRLALNARKRTARTPESSLGEAAFLAHATTPETERRKRELGLAIERAAAMLSDEQRAVFVLADFHGMSLAEVAAALDTSESTVKTRLFRARASLRERLDGFEKGWREGL